jgi:glycosyltransferase involved in cell wall biosynthesis
MNARSARGKMKNKQRILTMSHAHPDFSLGGGEIAAYGLYQAMRERPDVESAWFLARADRGRGATGAISMRRPDEYLWEQAVHDWHGMKAVNLDSTLTRFAELVRALRPTIVHSHHYAHMGLEYLRVIKQVDPAIRIYLTLHEYMAICRNNGQMIKTGGLRLCSSESPDECHRCFPQSQPEDFWLRKHGFMNAFALVDRFIAPSEFLRQRYIRWGLSPERVVVIENGQSALPPLPPREIADGASRNRFAFFGQINPYKGIDVLLEALHTLPKSAARQLVVEIHGANLELQEGELQQKVRDLCAPLIKKGTLSWMGPYRPEEQRQRLAGVDWVVVPSIWWENSPMVIQEAFACGRPVIVSDIGGMAEKVRHGIDGLHASVGNPRQWGETLVKAATTKGLWEQLASGIRQPESTAAIAQRHIDLMEQATASA